MLNWIPYRDSAKWAFGMWTSILVALVGYTQLIHDAFPALSPVWDKRLALAAAISAVVAAKMSASPQALSPDNSMATGRSDQTLNPITGNPKPKE